MMDVVTFEKENHERIQAVETSFGPAGKTLSQPGRVLVGQGRLIKQGRRKIEPKVFFLFNDVLVYGSIILNGRWHKSQKIIPLEDVMLEDIDDKAGLSNKWLMYTPCKSFVVSADSFEDKQAWMEHIGNCRSNLLQRRGSQAVSTYAVPWIPDMAAYKCMRCFNNFTGTNRRHHCRKCGFLVCNACSKQRAVIEHIHPTKRLRVCSLCHKKDEEMSRLRGDSTGKNSAEEDYEEACSDEEEGAKTKQNSSWLDYQSGTWGHNNAYVVPTPMC
ncbi:LOW QUALITY PROTEIN: pleckstrin homology domain-containing family F member 2-like [Eleginops maclovinus]|uniref:LOW QUALITY PROTEIN: pleckstrin homology domain-containing family F member 2-like n=1 Tax=Eleginops maclovinus TaxID=56733 RepID=UPI003080B6F9